MAGRIKGITVEIGGDVTGLNKALSSTNKNIWDTQSQLKDVQRLLKLDPGNTELLEQQQRLLAEAVEETAEKLDVLKQAEKQVQQQFERGEVSQAQYEGLQREIIATSANLRKLEAEAQDAAHAVNRVDEDPVEDVEKAAKEAGKALDDAGDSASSFGDILKAEVVAEGISRIAGAISDLNEETMEYRKIMGTLETSSQAAGYTAEETGQSFRQLYAVLGDEQATATTLANLQSLRLEQADLVGLTDAAIGAWAKYGDSVPIDSLAEAISETIKCGTVTSSFADILNWGSEEGENFGVTLRENTEANKEWNDSVMDAVTAEDFFNLALQECTTEAERANLVYRAMSDQGLASMADAWRQNNEDMVAANEAQADFMEKASQLSERFSPIMEEMQEGVNGLLDLLLELTEDIDFDALADMVSSVFTVVESAIRFVVDNHELILSLLAGIGAGLAALKLVETVQTIMTATSVLTGLMEVFPALGGAVALFTNPVFLVTAAIVALITATALFGDEMQSTLSGVDSFLQNVFAKDWTEVFGPVLGNSLNGFYAGMKNIWDAIYDIFYGMIGFIRGVFTGDWDRAMQGLTQSTRGQFEMIAAIAKIPLNALIGMLNALSAGVNVIIDGLNGMGFDMPDWLGGGSFRLNIPHIPSIVFLAKGGILSDGNAIVGENGPELLSVANGRAVVQPLPGNNSRIESLLGDISGQLGGGSSPIVVQVVLDGKVVGETAMKYIRGRERANG